MVRIGSLVLALGVWFQGQVALGEDGAPSASDGSRDSVISGQVAYSDPNAKGRNYQLEAQDSIEAWIKKAQSAAKSGGEAPLEDLDSETASYLSVLYFYCTAKEGPCPFVLDSVLDVEIMQARASKDASCVTMKRFFKSYLKHGLDDRGKFLYSLTRGLEMASFNEQSRPRYLDCQETVGAIMNDKELLAQRFGEKGTSLESFAKLANLVNEVKTSKTDIFVATGLSKAEE